jgi:hypothetical protein
LLSGDMTVRGSNFGNFLCIFLRDCAMTSSRDFAQH